MRLEPVYLVAPEPEIDPTPRVSRRKALSCVALAFGLGAAAGLGMGSWLARSVDPGAAEQTSAALRWALETQDGPLVTLVRDHVTFLGVFSDENDERLLPGLRRLCDAVLENDPAVETARVHLAGALADIVERAAAAAAMRELVIPLRNIGGTLDRRR